MKKALLAFIPLILSACLAGASPNTLSEVSESSVNQLETLHAQAEGQIVQNDFQGAIRTYQDILLLEPDDEVAYTNLGRIYMISGEARKAEEAFQNALNINPENESALTGLEKIKDPDHGFIMDAELESEVMPQDPLTSKSYSSTTPAIAVTAKIKDLSEVPVQREIQIQHALKNAGLYEGAIDGKLGPATREAIRRFQKFRGLAPDGIVGVKTWALLEVYLSAPEKAGSA